LGKTVAKPQRVPSSNGFSGDLHVKALDVL
jgi:hypothetical protein